jgi:hypothetical protein
VRNTTMAMRGLFRESILLEGRVGGDTSERRDGG